MRKGLFCAVLLVAGLAACGRGGDNASDDALLNNAATMLDDNGVFDTSADDAALNQAALSAEEGNGAAATAPANGAAPANSAAATGNQQ